MKNVVLLMAVILLLAGCTEKQTDYKEVTFIIYMAADNSLSEFAVLDIDEMERSEFDPARANVIVQADFSVQTPDPSCRRYEIMPDSLWDYEISSPVIDNLGEIDSGDWQSLTGFYNWCTSKYPAERYVLSIWSHGNNWYSQPANPNKFCPDSESGSFFDIPEGDLRRAFAGFEQKPDLLILDACHMQSIEVLSEIYTNCHNVCASTDIIPEYGFPYAEVITAVCADSIGDYTMLPQLFVDSYKPGGTQNPVGAISQEVNASLINCEVFSDELLPALAYFRDIYDIASFGTLNEFRDQCQEFNDLEIDIDLIQFFEIVAKSAEFPQVRDAAERINQDLIAANAFYYYPAAPVGNLQITYPAFEYLAYWNNLWSEYQQLQFDQMTGWWQFVHDNNDFEENRQITP